MRMADQPQRYCPGAERLIPDEACHHWNDRQQKAQRLAALDIVARELAGHPQHKHLGVQCALERLEELLSWRRCTVLLLGDDGQELYVDSAPALTDRPSIRYRRGQGINGRVLASGKRCIVPRISDEPSFLNMIHHREDHESRDFAYICVPITVDQQVVGTLAADIPIHLGDLDEQADLLGIISTMIAHDAQLRREAEAEQLALTEENLRLRQRLGERLGPTHMIGRSRPMQEVLLRIAQVAPSDITVLITGESGTGKELVAEAIHFSSGRSAKPLVRVNCAALNEHLLESELFGHEKGAFTGAVQQRRGRLEEAEGGTLFLDEIGEFSQATQVKMLRVLQQRQFERVGSNQTITADVRIVCATNRNLQAMVESGLFRLDLFYRINVFPLHLPPLRDRRADIVALADHFADIYGKRLGKNIQRISTPAINAMLSYHWPGNIRELENSLEHAVVLAEEGVIHQHHLPPSLQMPPEEAELHPLSLESRVAALERDLISDALKRCDGNISAAARLLDTTPRIARYKAKQLGLLD
ncbi:MAG: GAF domain-containing protein [Planctomycetota bacterium]|nr:MAG: GAF domain-containing protein [Planctomycetota bacterium]